MTMNLFELCRNNTTIYNRALYEPVEQSKGTWMLYAESRPIFRVFKIVQIYVVRGYLVFDLSEACSAVFFAAR